MHSMIRVNLSQAPDALPENDFYRFYAYLGEISESRACVCASDPGKEVVELDSDSVLVIDFLERTAHIKPHKLQAE